VSLSQFNDTTFLKQYNMKEIENIMKVLRKFFARYFKTAKLKKMAKNVHKHKKRIDFIINPLLLYSIHFNQSNPHQEYHL
jgi:division protein CdvB (Snf7/Vps24/ESCRT-III family)